MLICLKQFTKSNVKHKCFNNLKKEKAKQKKKRRTLNVNMKSNTWDFVIGIYGVTA